MKQITNIFMRLLILTFLYFSNLLNAAELKIYSERQPMLIEPLLDTFQLQTGIEVEWIYSQKGLVQKIILEKDNPVADIFLASDISRLIDVAQEEASIKIQPVSNIPLHLQSDRWIGLSQRARIIYASKDLNLESISYEDLATQEYKGRVCIRSGFHPYNISLFASLLEHYDNQWLEDYLVNLKSNLARRPQGNDRDQVKAIYAGVCDVSIGNHYYFFKMQDNDNQKKWLENVTIIFPNQNDRGAHVNISGIAILKDTNKELAQQLVAFLTSSKAQSIYANDNNEFPVSPDVPSSEKVLSIAGNATFDQLELEKIASNRKMVIDILNKINFDQ